LKIAIGSDHAGFSLKNYLIKSLEAEGIEMIDCGTYSEDPVDYPDIALALSEKVLQSQIIGILVCGTGIGIAIAANKIMGIRAAVCQDIYTACLSRKHNDANIITIGSRITAPEYAMEIVKTFIKTEFEAGRHLARIEKISSIEKKCRERS